MDINKLFEQARVRQAKNKYLTTQQLEPAMYMDSPWGKALINSITPAKYAIKLNDRKLNLYTITLITDYGVKTITVAESTRWELVG